MKIAFSVFIFFSAIFLLSGWQNHTRYHFFVPLADAFLHGRLYVDKMQPELHEMIPDDEVRSGIYTELVDGQNGKYYVIYPPLPALLLMPVVAIFGTSTNQSYFSSILAATSVAISYLVFELITKKRSAALSLTILYGCGSMLWYHAIIGSSWYYSQVCGLLFLWVAILATLKKKHPFLIGLAVGLAYLSRYPLLLSFPFFIFMIKDEWLSGKTINLRPLGFFCCSFVICISLSLCYNWSRYGRLGHYGYTVLEKRPYNLQNEYTEGSYSLRYAPRTLKAMLWSFPNVQSKFPFVVPNMWAMALWFVFPAVFIIPWAPIKDKLTQASWLAVLSIFPISLFHGGVGATQFGYRYALDFMPFLLILIALAVRYRFYFWHNLLFVLSIVANIWGIWSTFVQW